MVRQYDSAVRRLSSSDMSMSGTVVGWRDMAPGDARANVVKWTICAVAAMGFLFDIYVVLVGPLIVEPALAELGNLEPGAPAYRDWAGTLFWIPPLVGGFFGLWGGYLTDRFGRRSVLTWSIVLYALS